MPVQTNIAAMLGAAATEFCNMSDEEPRIRMQFYREYEKSRPGRYVGRLGFVLFAALLAVVFLVLR